MKPTSDSKTFDEIFGNINTVKISSCKILERKLKAASRILKSEFGKVKQFSKLSEEWLDFIVACRLGHPHEYDIVEGPMADDTIFNYVQNFVDGKISREAFWELARFKRPTHQISFHTARALATLAFVKGVEVRDEE